MDVEGLYLFHKNGKIPIDDLIEQYLNLDEKEITEFIDLVVNDDLSLDKKADIFLILSIYAGSPEKPLPDKLFDYLVDHRIYKYGMIFKRASETIAKRLVDILGRENGIDSEELVRALWVIPGATTDNFKQTNRTIPDYTKENEMLVALLHEGELEDEDLSEEDCNKKILYSDLVLVFQRADKSEASDLVPLKPLAVECGYCSLPLTLVFDGEKMLATCLNCSCYETLFVRQDALGIHWHEKNKPQSLLKEDPNYTKDFGEVNFDYALKLVGQRKMEKLIADDFTEEFYSQIGGLPTEINYVDVPLCPDCQAKMVFVAQLSMADVQDLGEGIYYFYTCQKCNVHAANFDQT